MRLKTVRLEMARNPGHPDSNAACGYEIKVLLDIGGRIDLAAFQRPHGACTVRRFWRGEDEKIHHTRHGSCAFSYAPGEDDDEPLFRLESHAQSCAAALTFAREAEGKRPSGLTS